MQRSWALSRCKRAKVNNLIRRLWRPKTTSVSISHAQTYTHRKTQKALNICGLKTIIIKQMEMGLISFRFFFTLLWFSTLIHLFWRTEKEELSWCKSRGIGYDVNQSRNIFFFWFKRKIGEQKSFEICDDDRIKVEKRYLFSCAVK